jgi:hypothetical protein
MFAAKRTRPLPRVWPRSAKIGPDEVAVRTGKPSAERPQMAPPEAALSGMLAMLIPIALVSNSIRLAPPVTTAGL